MQMKPDRLNLLPLSCPPRGLSRTQAAAYIGVSPSLFDLMVQDGRMPRPKHINSRKIWDRLKIDVAFDALLGDEEDPNPWDSIDPFLSQDESLERMRKAGGKAACEEHQAEGDWSAGKSDAEILRMFKIRDPRKKYKHDNGFDVSILPQRVQEILKREYERRGYPWGD